MWWSRARSAVAGERVGDCSGAIRPERARAELATFEPRRHDLPPLGICGDHLGALAAIADAAFDVIPADAVVRQPFRAGHFAEVAVFEPPYPQFFREVRAVDIGDFDFAVAVEISRTNGGKPAMRLADMGCLRDAAFRPPHGQPPALGQGGFHDDHFRRTIAVEVGQPGGEVFEHKLFRQSEKPPRAVA